MLYIGTLDDKTIEYPFGGYASINNRVSDSFILFHALFTHEPILEEGFLLASQEATELTEPRLLLEAIKAGLFKVLSRYHDLPRYVQERRLFNHPCPPDTSSGNSYIVSLQDACVQSGAFLDYPPSHIDEITFLRTLKLIDSDNVQEMFNFLEFDIPRDLKSAFEYFYENNPKGGRWTCRSAFEHAIYNIEIHDPALRQGLMCLVNRERQIVRAAAASAVNNVVIDVETGAGPGAEDLIESSLHDTHGESPYIPSVRIPFLLKNALTIFNELSNPSSLLYQAKSIYISSLESWQNSPTKSNLRMVTDAGKLYETYLLETGEISRTERNLWEAGTAFIVGSTTALATSGAARAIAKSRSKQQSRPLFSKKLKSLPSTISRRQVLHSLGIGSVIMTGAYAESQSGTITAQIGRTLRSFDGLSTDAVSSSLFDTASSHVRLAINLTAGREMLG